jgi:hypothetical protein
MKIGKISSDDLRLLIILLPQLEKEVTEARDGLK